MPSAHLKNQSRRRVKRLLDESSCNYEKLGDEHEADFRVHPKDGGCPFNILAYGRCILWAKGRNHDLRIAFCHHPPDSDNCEVYMYPHNELLEPFLKGEVENIAHPKNWKGGYRSWSKLPKWLRQMLKDRGYQIA